MKLVNANSIRAEYLKVIMEQFADNDIGMIASNSFNVPVVAEDGEEGWVEIVVKVTKDTGDDGYMKREQYHDKQVAAEDRKAKKEAKAKADAEKREKQKLEN